MVYHLDVVELPVQEQTFDSKTGAGNLVQEEVNDVGELLAFSDVFHGQGVPLVPQNDVDGGIDEEPCSSFFCPGFAGVAFDGLLTVVGYLIEVNGESQRSSREGVKDPLLEHYVDLFLQFIECETFQPVPDRALSRSVVIELAHLIVRGLSYTRTEDMMEDSSPAVDGVGTGLKVEKPKDNADRKP